MFPPSTTADIGPTVIAALRKTMLIVAWGALATATAVLADDTPSPAPLRIHELTRQIEIHPDGSSVTATHTEIQILTDALLLQMAQQTLKYDPAFQKLTVTEAYTLKADGTKIAVLPDAILDRQSQESGAALIVTDTREKVIVFPQVEVGDTVVFSTTVETASPLPGYFAYDTVFPRALLIDDTRLTVTAPSSLALAVSAMGISDKKSTHGGTTTYSVAFSVDKPVSDLTEPVSNFDRGPKFSVSTFKTYDQLAQAYARLVQAKVAVTPAIAAQANTITAGTADPREQARRIYDWVSMHVRYVAIELGVGGFVPHDPESVMSRGYGDCKDHAALFASLLKAKGIDSQLVLINAVNAYTVSDVPTFSAFNHMIVWLPQFGVYADTTSGISSFGSLPQSEYGKPVLHVVTTGPALHRTPLASADDATIHYTTVAKLDDDDRLAVSTTATGTGRLAAALRVYAKLIRANGGPKLAGSFLKQIGANQATGDFVLPPAADLADVYSLTSHYETPSKDISSTGMPFRPPLGLDLISPVGEIFLGPIASAKFNKTSDAPCYSGRLIEDYSLQLPADKHVEKLPDDIDRHAGPFRYTSHWSTDGGTLNIHREFSATFDKALCPGATHGDLNDALGAVREALNTRIVLAENP
ncbi:MAG TPA: DUF3857 and transglutaminase domain-containing protein [Rhizomicrobium sp.]|nr:DUF3857 and transglutaminase domain-containing protein [Rhizomicrobium sp.]